MLSKAGIVYAFPRKFDKIFYFGQNGMDKFLWKRRRCPAALRTLFVLRVGKFIISRLRHALPCATAGARHYIRRPPGGARAHLPRFSAPSPWPFLCSCSTRSSRGSGWLTCFVHILWARQTLQKKWHPTTELVFLRRRLSARAT